MRACASVTWPSARVMGLWCELLLGMPKDFSYGSWVLAGWAHLLGQCMTMWAVWPGASKNNVWTCLDFVLLHAWVLYLCLVDGGAGSKSAVYVLGM